MADAALGGGWINRNLQQVSNMGVDGGTPGKFFNAVRIIEPYAPVLIKIVGTYPPCGLNVSQEVGNKRQSTFPGLVRQSQKLYAVVNIKLPDDFDSTSIFSKAISHRFHDGSSGDLYTHNSMNFAADPVQIQTPQFMDLSFLIFNALDEVSGLSTPTITILRPTDGAHWIAPNHVFGETAAVEVSEAKSDYDYNYKTEFQIWR